MKVSCSSSALIEPSYTIVQSGHSAWLACSKTAVRASVDGVCPPTPIRQAKGE